MEAVLTLTEHPTGTTVPSGARILYDLGADTAQFGGGATTGPSVLWELAIPQYEAEQSPSRERGGLSAAVTLDSTRRWLMRCDRVDFPPGAVADWHFHPGPGIRRLLFGELTVTTGGGATVHGRGDPWFESGPEPVHAAASATRPTAFVRVMLLPAEWAGRRTIRYINPPASEQSVRQRARVLVEESLV